MFNIEVIDRSIEDAGNALSTCVGGRVVIEEPGPIMHAAETRYLIGNVACDRIASFFLPVGEYLKGFFHFDGMCLETFAGIEKQTVEELAFQWVVELSRCTLSNMKP